MPLKAVFRSADSLAKSEVNITSPVLRQSESVSTVDVYRDAIPLLDIYRRVFCPSAYRESNPVKGFPLAILLPKLLFLLLMVQISSRYLGPLAL